MSSEMLAENQELEQPRIGPASDGGNTLRDDVEKALSNYFSQLDGAPVTDVYQLVLTEVEAPLLEQVLKYTRNNQTKASVLLGLNRGTLRKKLKQYGLL
jgi:Fis family transcriptional regulator, factor for inversion stimulation protein